LDYTGSTGFAFEFVTEGSDAAACSDNRVF